VVVLLLLDTPIAAAADRGAPKAENRATFRVPLGERQLFLDDHGIASIEHLERTMHQPAKKGAVIRPDTTMGINSLQIRMAPTWSPEKKVWQLWDCGSEPQELHAKGYYFSGYYESTDGLHWTKPVVGQIEYRGSKENNFVTVIVGGERHRVECLVYDPAEPDPLRRYKVAMPNFGLAVSPDGIKWKMLQGIAPIPSGDEYNLSLDEREHLFLLTLKTGGPHGRSVGLATTRDFKRWKNHGLIFHADDLDQKLGRENIKVRLADPTLEPIRYNNPAVYNVDVYNMGVFRYEGLYVGMPAMYHATGPVPNYPNTDGFHLVQLTCSRDLKTWKRLGDRKPFIGPSRRDSGAYDLTQIIGPSNAVLRGDDLWFYYTGTKYRAAGSDIVAGKWLRRPGSDQDDAAACLAMLRRDGFISLDAGETEGTVLTKAFTLPGGKLFVNVDAFKGELRVEIVAENGKVLAVSKPMKGDLPRGETKWRKGDLGRLKGQTVSLRFTLRNASLYSYWVEYTQLASSDER